MLVTQQGTASNCDILSTGHHFVNDLSLKLPKMLAVLGLICLFSSMVIIPGGNCSDVQRRDDDDVKITEANDYLDDVITNTIEENRDKLEPYRPENTTFSFEKKILLVTYKREVSLYDMVITGLTTVHREGDCERKNNKGVSKLSANLGMGVLEFESKASFKVMKLGPTFKLFGKIGYLMIHLEVTRDNNAGTPPKVKKLEIYDQKGTELKVSGLGPFNHFSEKIIEAAMKFLKGKINRKIEEKLKEHLDEKFEDSVFPID